MRHLIYGLLALASLSAAPAQQTFTGTITDHMCGDADHSRMRMGRTAAECTIACVMAHDAMYVLFDGRDTYTLSDQRTPEQFAGQNVRIAGTLDPRTKVIQVDSITALPDETRR